MESSKRGMEKKVEKNLEQPTIVSPALAYDADEGDGLPVVFTAPNHYDALLELKEVYKSIDESRVRKGFWTSDSRFVTKKEADDIAAKAGQKEKSVGTPEKPLITYE